MTRRIALPVRPRVRMVDSAPHPSLLWRTGTPPLGALRVVAGIPIETLHRRAGTVDLRPPADELGPLVRVQGAPVDWAVGVLDAQFQRAILLLAGSLDREVHGALVVDAGPNGIAVTVQSRVFGDAGADDHVDRLRTPLEELAGLILRSGTASPAPLTEFRGTCALCGYEIPGMARKCDCGRLHHPECWRLFGECAHFPCGGRRGEEFLVRAETESAPALEADGIRYRTEWLPGRGRGLEGFRIHFDWASPGQLHIAPEGLWDFLDKVFGGQDVTLGEPALDEVLRIRGAPEGWIRQVLDADGRRILRLLLDVSESGSIRANLEVDAGPAGLVLTVPRGLPRARARSFVEQAEFLLRKFRGPTSVRMTDLQAGEAPTCPVCAQPLAECVRRCAACGTPHHTECWAYFGGCAVYACGGR